MLVKDSHHPKLIPMVSNYKEYTFKEANFPELFSALLNTNWNFLNEFNLQCFLQENIRIVL